MRKIFKNGGKLVCLIFLLILGEVNAQATVPGGTGDAPGTPVPIDGGASILAAAGVAYGIKKYRDYKKGSEDQETEI